MSTAYELLDELGKQIGDVVVYTMKEWRKINDAVADLEAENKRLRRALESVNYWMHETSPPWPTEQDAARAGGIAKIVSRALKEGE